MYKITFTDETSFQGGEPQNSKWNEMPDKPIKKLEYDIDKGKIVMEDYEAYNHVYEVTSIMGRTTYVSKLMLMVKKGEDVMIIIYDFIKGRFYSEVAIFGKEYYNKPLKGWKKGILGGKPKCEIK